MEDFMRGPKPGTEFADHSEIALGISKGAADVPTVNPNFKRVVKKRPEYSVDEYYRGIVAGDRVKLAQAITLVESSLPKHKALAQDLIQKCLPHTGNSVRLGITGVPGAGKSTFIETFGTWLHDEKQRKIAVLAIDPSSQVTGGSILGDKTRMNELSVRPNVFIRPSPSGTSLGGVAQKTRESALLCEAAGFDLIIIETVGVGQSETAVHSMVDFFLLLMLAGAGDELQGIKRGIMEMADGIAITKADGHNVHKAKGARVQYQNALRLFPPNPWKWTPQVVTTSSVERTGIADVWEMVENFENLLKEGDWWDSRRRSQLQGWMEESIELKLREDFFGHGQVAAQYESIKQQVLSAELSPFQAAENLLKLYKDS